MWPIFTRILSQGHFNLLHNRLAVALGKDPTDFKEYQKALEAVKKAREKGDKQLENLTKSDDRYGWAVKVGSEIVKLGLRTASHGVINDKVVDSAGEVAGKGVKIGATELKQLRDRLHDKLSTSLGDYLEPELRLGRGIGHDLAKWAKGRPLVIFFDTYEVADEADDFLRIVMGAAGERVGWVIAGRDNLWTNQGERNEKKGLPGYRDLVKPEYSLAVNFDSPDEGNFSQSDLKTYFAELTRLDSTLPLLEDDENVERVWQVTQGVPLAVSIAAGLYLETRDLTLITSKGSPREEIVGQMVERYLLHTNSAPADRLKLYGLALLRRADHPDALRVALNLDAESDTATELRRLNRRYSFIFQARQPVLHQEVRYFMREWLRLERRRDDQILVINKRLYEKYLSDLLTLEEHQEFTSLQERLENDRWFELYCDLAEQQFWLNPDQGVTNVLPLILASAIYRRTSTEEVLKLGEFFEGELTHPTVRYWRWATTGLKRSYSVNASQEEVNGLEELLYLAQQRCPKFSAELKLPDFRQELEAAIWWRRAESWKNIDDSKAIEWYEKVLNRLPQSQQLREAAAETYLRLVQDRLLKGELGKEDILRQSLAFLEKCLYLSPGFTDAYFYKGAAYQMLGNFEQAILEYTQGIALNPGEAHLYASRGDSHVFLEQYEQALNDYNYAIDLDPDNGFLYDTRGDIFDKLEQYEGAISDYSKSIELASDGFETFTLFVYQNRGDIYAKIGKYEEAIADYTKAIEMDPNRAYSYSQRGDIYDELGEYEKAFADYAKAVELDPACAYAYYQRGNHYLELEQYEQAITYYKQALAANYDISNTYFYLGRACLELGQVDEALANCTKAIETNPRFYLAYFLRAHLYSLLNQPHEAITDYSQAINIEPKSAPAYFSRALAYFRLEQYQEALSDFSIAITFKDDISDYEEIKGSIYLLKGVIHEGLGQYEQVLSEITKALESGLESGFATVQFLRRG